MSRHQSESLDEWSPLDVAREFTKHVIENGPDTLERWTRSIGAETLGINPQFFDRLLHTGVLYDEGVWDRVYRHGYASDEEAMKQFDYGLVDFGIGGFPAIREHFTRSVVPILIDTGYDNTVGTGWLVGPNRIITAGHNVQRGYEFSLGIEEDYEIRRLQWHVELDLAQITLDSPLARKPFQTDYAQMLDEVLVMGYPTFLKYDQFQAAEVGQIAGIKSTTGTVIGQADHMPNPPGKRLLVSARIMKGHSGGPVINRLGRVVGVVEQQDGPVSSSADVPADDLLGFAAAIPLGSKIPMDVHVGIEIDGRSARVVDETTWSTFHL